MPVPRINEDYVTQVSEEIEGRVTEKLSQEFSRTESRFLGALSKLDEFLMNSQVQTHSVIVPRTFRNTDMENQEPSYDRSQNDSRPEVRSFVYRSPQLVDSDPDEAPESYQTVTQFDRKIRFCLR